MRKTRKITWSLGSSLAAKTVKVELESWYELTTSRKCFWEGQYIKLLAPEFYI